ncbi:MAG: DUF4422 domain-containing protein [Lachnospiraceae bacterium]|nr:DUF4422 domain-containing protein [Lachnospiraceae bacterium]
MKIKIIIATHKKYWMPEDSVYLPVHVGAEGKYREDGSALDLGYVKDNTGENISDKNANYCELTGLYWAWKNLDAEYIGLAHYRRHFCAKSVKGNKQDCVLTYNQAKELLGESDILLPKKRNYFIETNYSQYAHAHHAIDLDTTREIIKEKCPEYLKAFDKSMKKTTGHRFNMFIMSKTKLDEYCKWLFDILFELEKRLDISEYSANDSRVFGFVSERLLDVWLDTKGYGYKDIPYVFMEKQNWIIKGTNFLKRKLGLKG